MDIKSPIDFILHIDRYLGGIIQSYGILTYALIFFIIFLETGFVFTPFLPGDSLLFAAGAFASKGVLDVYVLFILLSLAAILGDSVNYFAGKYLGEKIFEKSRFVKKEHLEKTKEFYQKHGAKTIILARFVPIVRTFAPLVAGIGKMDYKRFLFYNVIGGVCWVVLFVFGGYFFGNIPLVKNNFSIAVMVIIFISILPVIFEFIRHKIRKRQNNFFKL